MLQHLTSFGLINENLIYIEIATIAYDLKNIFYLQPNLASSKNNLITLF